MDFIGLFLMEFFYFIHVFVHDREVLMSILVEEEEKFLLVCQFQLPFKRLTNYIIYVLQNSG